MSSDPHTGGTLEQMAVKGTSIPNDAGVQNTIPSTSNPSTDPSSLQSSKTAYNGDPNPLGSRPDAQSGANNALDAPRSAADGGATGEVVSGTGAAVPATVETKRLDPSGGDRFQAVGAHGHAREAKQEKGVGAFGRSAGEGAEAQPAPGEEGDAQDAVRDRKRL
ncbi:hypothetical protein MPH_09392 [Macrophomina phaseolina MS6]|uniref:Uncharacterized protein n=1 Tax=Macrophomina phaseolina (strain MS6) TaxID=1126212 RepID=K2QUC1_MACPH|nr:hypothetical protein MPH_09392 [Macrophomina phaseolina MS6]